MSIKLGASIYQFGPIVLISLGGILGGCTYRAVTRL